MVRLIGSLGGWLGRKCDGEPGPKAMWVGMQRMTDLALGWRARGEVQASPGANRRGSARRREEETVHGGGSFRHADGRRGPDRQQVRKVVGNDEGGAPGWFVAPLRGKSVVASREESQNSKGYRRFTRVSYGFGAVARNFVRRPESGSREPSDGEGHRTGSPATNESERNAGPGFSSQRTARSGQRTQGRAKTSAGRSDIPSLAFHAAA
jgi:hypothetical protein